MKESAATQIGRDDYRAFQAIASSFPESVMKCDQPPILFPKGSQDVMDW